MAFVSLNQKELQRALQLCNQISPKRSEVDIFTYLRIKLSPDSLHLNALSQSISYTTQLTPTKTDVQSSLEFLIKTDILTGAVAVISDDQVGIQIDLETTSLIVQGAKAKHSLRIKVDSVDDFSVPVRKPDELQSEVSVQVDSFSSAVKLAMSTVGQPKNVYQPEFLSVCISHRPDDNAIAVASSDKYRIARTVVPATYSKAPEQADGGVNNLLLPKPLQLLVHNLDDVESVTMSFEQEYLWVSTGNSTFVLRYGDGSFPDYERIIPQSFGCSFLVNVKDATDALKQVQLTARTNVINKTLSMQVFPSQEKLILTAKSDDGYSSEAELQMQGYQGVDEDWKQAFNADYLMDYISLVPTLNVLMECNPGKPMVMSPESDRARQLCLVQGLR